MANYEMTKKGSHYTEPGLSFSWGINQERSEVVSIDDDKVSGRLQQHIANGRVRKTDRKATRQVRMQQVERRLLTGDDARAHRAIPAGEVYRWALDPVSGERIKVTIKLPGQNAPLEDDGVERPAPPVTGSGTPDQESTDEETDDDASSSTDASSASEEAPADGESPAAGESDTASETPQADTRTKAELIAEAKKLGLPQGGNRQDLIDRIAAAKG